MNNKYQYDPYQGYEEIHGEAPVPKGDFCFYEDNTLCLYAEEDESGKSFCKKHYANLQRGYYKLPQCD